MSNGFFHLFLLPFHGFHNNCGTRIAVDGGPGKSAAIFSNCSLLEKVFNMIRLVAYALADKHYK